MIELQDIFRDYGHSYRDSHNLYLNQLKAMSSIQSCRTSALGSHVDICDDCEYTRISYNSCRNRHCPKCQNMSKEQWIEDRKADLLPVQYFHVVFTVPDSLNTVVFQNQEFVYAVLFKAVSETIGELALDKKYLGGQVGITSILHTWGQNLMFHPHIHCIVPGGGLSSSGIEFFHSKKKFFIPVRVLSRKFRGKFLYYLKHAFNNGMLNFYGDSSDLIVPQNFQSLLDSLYCIDWIVYCKKPFKSPYHVIEYFGRYTHKIAISNNRIVEIKNDMVTFKWRDYKDSSKNKFMTLNVNEFIRRFLLLVLPHRFVRIRHYGILSNKNRKTKLAICKRLTKANFYPIEKLSSQQMYMKLTGIDLDLCPCCGGKMVRRLSIPFIRPAG